LRDAKLFAFWSRFLPSVKKLAVVRFSLLALLILGLVGGASALPETGGGLSTSFQGDLDVAYGDTNYNIKYVDNS